MGQHGFKSQQLLCNQDATIHEQNEQTIQNAYSNDVLYFGTLNWLRSFLKSRYKSLQLLYIYILKFLLFFPHQNMNIAWRTQEIQFLSTQSKILLIKVRFKLDVT